MPTVCHLRPIHRRANGLLLRVNVPLRDVHVAVPWQCSQTLALINFSLRNCWYWKLRDCGLGWWWRDRPEWRMEYVLQSFPEFWVDLMGTVDLSAVSRSYRFVVISSMDAF
jgi:hypothetical protein